MRLLKCLGGLLIVFIWCCPAHAVSGDLQVFSTGNSHTFGYCKAGARLCSLAVGSIANPFLSDGREVIGFFDIHAPTTPQAASVFLLIRGFTSNPGRGYITSLQVETCDRSPSILMSAAAGFLYEPTTGTARWEWGRQACMHGFASYRVILTGP